MRLYGPQGRILDDDPPLAIAAYVLDPLAPEHASARHVGIFRDADKAKSWLLTGTPGPNRIYEHDTDGQQT